MKQNAARRRFPMLRLALLGCLISSPLPLLAHPGHGLLEHGVLHHLASPFHFSLLALVGVALFGGAHVVRQRVPRRALQGLGALVVLGSAVLCGIQG